MIVWLNLMDFNSKSSGGKMFGTTNRVFLWNRICVVWCIEPTFGCSLCSTVIDNPVILYITPLLIKVLVVSLKLVFNEFTFLVFMKAIVVLCFFNSLQLWRNVVLMLNCRLYWRILWVNVVEGRGKIICLSKRRGAKCYLLMLFFLREWSENYAMYLPVILLFVL